MSDDHLEFQPPFPGQSVTLELLNRVRDAENTVLEMMVAICDEFDVDPRWMAIGKTDLQKGFMGVRRSIAFPNGD